MDAINYSNSEIKLVDRANISISGVTKLVSFDDEEFLMTTNLGDLRILGSTLELLKLDTTDGVVKIRGTIDSITYINGKLKTDKEGLLTKLFK